MHKVRLAANCAIRHWSPWMWSLPLVWSVSASFCSYDLQTGWLKGGWMSEQWDQKPPDLGTTRSCWPCAFGSDSLWCGLLWRKGGTVPPTSSFPLLPWVVPDSLLPLSCLSIQSQSYCLIEPGCVLPLGCAGIFAELAWLLWRLCCDLFFSSCSRGSELFGSSSELPSPPGWQWLWRLKDLKGRWAYLCRHYCVLSTTVRSLTPVLEPILDLSYVPGSGKRLKDFWCVIVTMQWSQCTRSPTSWRHSATIGLLWRWTQRTFLGTYDEAVHLEKIQHPRCGPVHCWLQWSSDQTVVQEVIQMSSLQPDSGYYHHHHLCENPGGQRQAKWECLVLNVSCCGQTFVVCDSTE